MVLNYFLCKWLTVNTDFFFACYEHRPPPPLQSVVLLSLKSSYTVGKGMGDVLTWARCCSRTLSWFLWTGLEGRCPCVVGRWWMTSFEEHFLPEQGCFCSVFFLTYTILSKMCFRVNKPFLMSKFVNAICKLRICFDSIDNYQKSMTN